MNNKVRSSKILLMFILGTLFALPAWCQATPKHAQSVSRSKETDARIGQLNDLLKTIQTSRSVKVVLANLNTPVYKTLISRGGPPQGCTYTTRNPAAIADLIKIIRSNVKLRETAKESEGGVREYIAMETVNGDIVEMMLGGSSGELVSGIALDKSDGKNVPTLDIEASYSIIRALYKWAVKVEPAKNCWYVTEYLKK